MHGAKPLKEPAARAFVIGHQRRHNNGLWQRNDFVAAWNSTPDYHLVGAVLALARVMSQRGNPLAQALRGRAVDGFVHGRTEVQVAFEGSHDRGR